MSNLQYLEKNNVIWMILQYEIIRRNTIYVIYR